MEKKLPCWPSAVPLLPEIAFWVACVSRLIGKFDTTGKCIGWQVHFGVTTVFDPCHVSPIEPRKHETPLSVEWRFDVCAGHWPPKHVRTVVISAAPSAGSFRPVSPLRGRCFGGGSCRVLLFFGLAGILSSSRYITGTLWVAIHGPFHFFHVFNYLRTLECFACLYSGICMGQKIQ